VTASTNKILNAYGPIPQVYREHKIEKMKNVVKSPNLSSSPTNLVGSSSSSGDNNFSDQESSNVDMEGSSSGDTPALIVLIVKVAVLERIMGPLTTYIRRHHVSTQAKIFSRVVC
jgi:hypothetical protein